jgi:hypothetical protein
MVAKSLATALQAEVPTMRTAAVIVLAALAVPSLAYADPVLGTSINITLEIRNDASSTGYLPPNETRREDHRLFNWARCVCGEATIDTPVAALPDPLVFAPRLELTGSTTASPELDIDLWMGTNCGDVATRAENCGTSPKRTIDLDDILRNRLNVEFNVYDFIDPARRTGCMTVEGSRVFFAVTDPDGTDGAFDDDVFSATWAIDTQPPTRPVRFTRASGGEGAIIVGWEPPSLTSPIFKYQLLCARADGTPVRATRSHEPVWEDPQALCPGEVTTRIPIRAIGIAGGAARVAGPFDAEPPDAEVPDAQLPDAQLPGDLDHLPAALQDLDPDYVCGEAGATATQIRVEGLENGVEHVFVLLVVDEAGNASAVTYRGTLTPRLVTDFWEDLHDRGSEVEGGFCLIAETYGDRGGPGGALTDRLRAFRDDTLAATPYGRFLIDVYYEHLAPLGAVAHESVAARIALGILLAPLVALALAWHALTLPGLIALVVAFRLRRRLRAVVIAAAAVAAPSLATAQSFAPYWEDGTAVEDPGPDAITWHAGVRFGPYLPGIDAQLGLDKGPYHEYFGGYNVMPVLDVDRILLHVGGGQLGVGGSIGVLAKRGPALIVDADGRTESDDETTFRLVPLAALGVYRFTMLDDEWGIPLVPYVRGGLSYYVWWSTKPNGAVSSVDVPPCMSDADTTCPQNKARGASLGLQGSLGLAVRAENIDAAAAASMRETGLYHAGFYAEYQLAWVDGFGSATKLAVGDNTWFVGVDFEF